MKKNTIGEAAKVTGLDISTLIELLPKIGLKIVYRTIDVNEAKIVPISPILNKL